MRTPSSRGQTTVLPPGEDPPRADSIAARTSLLIADHPYQYTSGDLIFAVYADRQGISGRSRPAARKEFYSKPHACLRSSDLGKRYGCGIHADADGRPALYGIETSQYSALASGQGPDGAGVSVLKAMRRSRP